MLVGVGIALVTPQLLSVFEELPLVFWGLRAQTLGFILMAAAGTVLLLFSNQRKTTPLV